MLIFTLLGLVTLGRAANEDAIAAADACTIPDVLDPSKKLWAPSAPNCENEYDEDTCRIHFPGDPVVPGQEANRPMKCWNEKNADGTYTPSDYWFGVARTYCAKKCGFCCLAENYKCEKFETPAGFNCNTPEAISACAAVTPQLCETSTEFRTIYANCCPKTCGFCKMNGCIDAMPSCKDTPAICTFPSMQSFVQQYCRKTCGLCEPCKYEPDADPYCEIRKANSGWCDDPKYPPRLIKQTCATTCKRC